MRLIQKINHPNILDTLIFYLFDLNDHFMLFTKMELAETTIEEKFK